MFNHTIGPYSFLLNFLFSKPSRAEEETCPSIYEINRDVQFTDGSCQPVNAQVVYVESFPTSVNWNSPRELINVEGRARHTLPVPSSNESSRFV